MSVTSIPRSFEELPLELIDDPELPARTKMSDEKMEELVESIRVYGLQVPMVVARVGNRFEVIAGHRRRIACTLAGLVVVPCVVYASKHDELEAVKLLENTKREDLNPADEALWFRDLLDKRCNGDIEKLCGLVGEKVTYVDDRLALLRGGQDVFEALQRGDIKVGVAHELNKIPDPRYRAYYLDCAIRVGATRATVIGWVTEWKGMFGGPQPPAPPATEAPVIVPQPSYDPHRCYICGENDPRYIPEQIPIHTHCKLAILEPLLKSYRGDGA